jgi:HEAT repeat protein
VRGLFNHLIAATQFVDLGNYFVSQHTEFMKQKIIFLLLCVTLAPQAFCASATQPAEITAVVAQAAAYQAGDNMEPLRQLETLLRQSQTDRALRKQLESELVKLLAPGASLEARRFACKQLAVIGSDLALPAIAELLKDKENVGFACLALTTYPPGKADTILRDALPASRGPARLQIIDTLGDRRDTKAVAALATIVREDEFAPKRAAIIALAKIGDAAARKALADLRRTSPSELERWFTEADLRLAEQSAKAGDGKAAAAVYEKLLTTSQSAAVRRGVFAALVRLDKDGGEARILQTLRSSDAVLKPVAIGAVRSLPAGGASEKFARELPGLSPEEQVWLIDSLAARADAPARAALIASLCSADAGVRRAAAAALSRHGGATAVRPFANAIAAAKDPDEIRALESALGSLPSDRDTDKAIIAEIKLARDDTRAHLISSLALRRDPQVMAALFEEADNPNPAVTKAAYRVLAKAAAGDQLPMLLKKFVALRNADLRSEVEGFVEQAVVVTDDVSRRSTAVRDALKQTADVPSRCALLRLLPACGDAQALAALNSAVSDTDARVRDAAIRALAEWPDSSAWGALSATWRKPETDAHRSLAFRGLVRLAGDANAHADENLVAHYREFLDGARSDDEIKLILGALGGLANPDALKLALPLLDKPGVRPEAEVAVKKIAEAVKGKHPEAAKAALERLKQKS